MNSRERIMKALNLGQPDRVPFADYTEEAIRKKIMGKEHFTAVEFAKKIGFDAINLDQDYTAPVFCEWKEVGGYRYMLGGLIKEDKDMGRMVFPDPDDHSFYDPAKRFVEEMESSGLAVYALCRFGISGVLYSMGLDGLSYALHENPQLVDRVLDRYVEWNCRMLEKLCTTGIDFILSYDNIAYNSGPMVSPQVFREVFVPKIKLVDRACKVPWVTHMCGNITELMEELLEMGVSGVHPLEPGCMDLKAVKEQYGSRVCLWGNIDLNYTLTRGTPEEVDAEVKQRITEAGPGGGYIMGSGCDLPDYCRVENILAMADAVKKYGRYPLAVD
jgi:uroporphyrinogen decarboxylase